MTEPRTPDPAADPGAHAAPDTALDAVPAGTSGAPAPTDRRADPPPAGSVWAGDHPPTTEAEREAVETVRSISRLEESN